VNSIQLSSNAILDIYEHISLGQYNFTATNGTASGTNAGTIEVQTGSTFTVGGVVSNSGAISLAYSTTHAAVLAFATVATLTGSGTVQMGGGVNAIFEGGGTAVTVTNLGNTISGGGRIGGGSMALVNQVQGVIDAAGKYALNLYAPGVTQTITNAGLIESTGPGDLDIVGTAIANTSTGVLLAAGGSTVSLINADILGGTLSTSGTGTIQTLKNGGGFTTSTLDGSNAAVINTGLLSVNAITTLDIVGAISNSGTIVLEEATGPSAGLVATGPTTLTGAGVVMLGDGANDTITGAAASDTLTNVGNTITGGGQLGAGDLILINDKAGVIDATGAVALTINTGTSTIANAGLIKATGLGAAIVDSAVKNTGTLGADGGTVTFEQAVSGGGMAVVSTGTLTFASTFGERVKFTGTTGRLTLAHSQSYTAVISGFSKNGGTSLDLEDIGFVRPGEATFSGTSKAGVLTVTDGVHTARLSLRGDYLRLTFTASSDGHGGVVVVAGPPAAAERPAPTTTLPFVTAMAGLGTDEAIHSQLFHRDPAIQVGALARPGGNRP
jgi:hypothetical protein